MTPTLGRSLASLLVSLCVAVPALAQLKSTDNPESSANWKMLRAELFAAKPIAAADEMMTIDAPPRAEDAAVVPVGIKMQFPQTPGRHVNKLYLILDNNPTPLAGVFSFTALSGRADIETRVRVDQYTYIRAVAEMNDGKLYMSTHFIKAAGGCSAPSSRDQAAAMASLGKMKLRIEGAPGDNRPVLAQLMISHPNNSGLAIDPVTKKPEPAYFVRHFAVTYAGEPVLSGEVDNAISENPNFRFYFVPKSDGELRAEVVDSSDKRFRSAVALKL